MPEPTGSQWRCDSVRGTLDAGTLFFYTRVASPTDTSSSIAGIGAIGAAAVPLRVGANARGFRTYSRNTVGAERTGNWRVELRTQAALARERSRVSNGIPCADPDENQTFVRRSE